MADVWAARGLSSAERVVLLAMADHADDAGKCWPAMGTLASKCEMTDRGVRKIVRRLAERGFLATELSRGSKSSTYLVTANPEQGSAVKPSNPEQCSRNGVPGIAPNPEPQGPQPGTVVPPNHQEPPIKEDTPFFPPSTELVSEPAPITNLAKRRKRILEEAVPNDRNIAAGEERRLGEQETRDEFERFKNYHLAKGSVFADWDRAWITWLDSPYRKRSVGRRDPGSDEGFAAGRDLARRMF